MTRCVPMVMVLLGSLSVAGAHDTWVETNTNLVRPGDAMHLNLMLGNHGNDHRDFKLASKIDLAGCTLTVVAPDGREYDVKSDLVDTGYAPKEGFWTGKFVADQPGMYMVAHTLDAVHHATRGIKSGKTCFVVTSSLDKVPRDNPGFDRPLGHALELVPLTNPVTPMGPGLPIEVQLLYQGKPLANARVAFVPRGTTLDQGFDDQFERMTDAEGRASYTPVDGNYILVSAHHAEPDQQGDGYEKTQFSATLTVYVPQLCPCCD
ncbi:MAG: DUF4198 domain-containing protein [Pirellulales bacterium]